MSEHTYKIIRWSVHPQRHRQAIKRHCARRQDLKNLDWFEVAETRGHLKDGKIVHYRATLRVGFELE